MNIHLLVSILAMASIGILLTYRLAHLVANLIEVLLPVLGSLGVLDLISGWFQKIQTPLVNG